MFKRDKAAGSTTARTQMASRQGILIGVVADVGLAAISGVQRRAGGEVVFTEARVVCLAPAIQVAGLCALETVCTAAKGTSKMMTVCHVMLCKSYRQHMSATVHRPALSIKVMVHFKHVNFNPCGASQCSAGIAFQITPQNIGA